MSEIALASDAAATRAGVVTYLTRKLSPLFKSGQLRCELAEWLAPLPTLTIVRALDASPEKTAEKLARALIEDSARRCPTSAIADVIATEFPKRPEAERDRLALLAEAMQRLAQANDGVVTEHALYHAGFGMSEQHRLAGDAAHVLAVVSGRAPLRKLADDEVSHRLLEAGVRSAARRSPALTVAA